jgi:hypothetical protein
MRTSAHCPALLKLLARHAGDNGASSRRLAHPQEQLPAFGVRTSAPHWIPRPCTALECGALHRFGFRGPSSPLVLLPSPLIRTFVQALQNQAPSMPRTAFRLPRSAGTYAPQRSKILNARGPWIPPLPWGPLSRGPLPGLRVPPKSAIAHRSRTLFGMISLFLAASRKPEGAAREEPAGGPAPDNRTRREP